eukprot:TRINITY_DN18364_c0_g1_i1.p1 TRINITY_DN18364_c0_g1~~TRINITY_DN18364_c0_g1_i1.p1  ORF type:complete len:211 (+),score=35.65 TRINITY_DN18364_c0_g1_i1:103-735(+)
MKLLSVSSFLVCLPTAVIGRLGQMLRASQAMIDTAGDEPATESVVNLTAATMGPIKLQVEEADLKVLSQQLSVGCDDQVTTMIRGDGSQLHQFGSGPHGPSTAGCASLNGTLCFTKATISDKKLMPAGRRGTSISNVEGNGCFPQHCMSESDLQALTHFMQLRALEVFVGIDVELRLSVDCTENGGPQVVVGVSENGDQSFKAKVSAVPS